MDLDGFGPATLTFSGECSTFAGEVAFMGAAKVLAAKTRERSGRMIFMGVGDLIGNPH
jgi:hypothetical protein